MKAVAKIWYYRKMTLMGKVLVINSLMASLFVYKMQVLPIITDTVVPQVEGAFKDFLWQGKREKIPLETLMLNKEDGGLGLVNIQIKHEALLYNWINDCREFENIRNLAAYHLGKYVTDNSIWGFNLNKLDSQCCFRGNSFWHSGVHMWHEYNHNSPQNGQRVWEQLLWFNSFILINGSPLQEKDSRCSLNTVEQIWHSNGNRFLSYTKCKQKCIMPMTWYRYASIIAAIPAHWKLFLKSENFIDNTVTKDSVIRNCQKVSQWVYQDKVACIEAVRKAVTTWNKKLASKENICDFQKHFKVLYCITNSVKLHNFQYRLLHNKIFCRDVLFHWKKTDDNICNFCNSEKQTILHLMFYCRCVMLIWQKMQTTVCKGGIDMELCISNIIYNNYYERPEHVLNTIVLIAKQFFYRCMCMNIEPSFQELCMEFKLKYEIEVENVKYKRN